MEFILKAEYSYYLSVQALSSSRLPSTILKIEILKIITLPVFCMAVKRRPTVHLT